jgi:hypothetical protein
MWEEWRKSEMGAAPRSEHVRQTTPKQHINAFEKYDASVEGRRRVRAVDKDSADDGCVVHHVNSGLGCTWSN